MGELPMTALARSRKPPMDLAPPRAHLARAWGDLPALCALLAPPPLIIVRGVIGPPLTIQVALQTPQRLGVRGDLGTEGSEQGVVCAHHCDGGGAQVEPNHAGSQRVLGFAVGCP